jgi:uncharacterized protein YuzE
VELRVTLDVFADVAYLYLVPDATRLAATTVPGEEEAGSVNLDFDRDGRLVGIEVLRASRWLAREVVERAERIGPRKPPTWPSATVAAWSSVR